MAVRFPDISGARKVARKSVRTALEERSAVLGAVSPDEPSARLLAAHRGVYRWRARRLAFEERVNVFGAGLLIALVFGALIAVAVVLGQRPDAETATAAFIIGCLFGGPPLHSLVVRVRFVQHVASAAFFVTLLAAAFLFWRGAGWADALAARPWLAALSGAIALAVVTLSATIPFAFAAVWLVTRYSRSRSQLALLTELFDLAVALTNPRALLDRRAFLLHKLNAAATVLETTFWRRRVRLADPLSRATWRDRCRQCAAHLRSFDLAIALPRADTREYLLGEVVSLIHVLLRGTLDDLPTAEPRPHRRLAAFGNAIRSLLLGLVPLGLVLAARYAAHLAGIQLPAGLASALGIGALAWFGLVVLMTFDSQAGNRMALLRDAADALSKFRSKP